MAKWNLVVTGLFLACGAAKVRAAESVSTTVTLDSVTGTTLTPIYNYDIALDDTGTTNIGTFWFGWIPGQDYLDTVPTSENSPTGWTSKLTGSGNSTDGTAIQWVAGAGAALAPGAILGAFDFSTTDAPAQIDGLSDSHPAAEVETSFVYTGAPFSTGFEFVAAPGAVPEPGPCGLFIGAAMVLGTRRPRRS